MAAECWLMVVDITALLLFPLSGISQRITIYYARAYARCIRYYPNVVTSYNNIPSPFRIMRLQGIPICTLLTRQPDGYVALEYLCFACNILMSVASKIGVKISCRTLGTVPYRHHYKLRIYELRGV